jgi:threonine aldolase
MVKIKTKRERIKFASDNVAGACPEVLDAILKANDVEELLNIISQSK